MNTYKDFLLSNEISLDSEERLFGFLRNLTVEEKLRMVCRMTASTRALVVAELKCRYPKESSEQLKIRLAEYLYGPELALEISSNIIEKAQ